MVECTEVRSVTLVCALHQRNEIKRPLLTSGTEMDLKGLRIAKMKIALKRCVYGTKTGCISLVLAGTNKF